MLGGGVGVGLVEVAGAVGMCRRFFILPLPTGDGGVASSPPMIGVAVGAVRKLGGEVGALVGRRSRVGVGWPGVVMPGRSRCAGRDTGTSGLATTVCGVVVGMGEAKIIGTAMTAAPAIRVVAAATLWM